MDYMIRGIDEKLSFRIFAVKSTNLVEKSRQLHNMSPTVSAALGRTLTAGLMMGYMMKGDKDKITIKINGGGPIGSIIVTSNNTGKIKGYVDNPTIDIPLKENGKLDVGKVVGLNGKVTVIKDLGLREPYVGSSDLVTGEIAEDIALYYYISEQQQSAVALGVLVDIDYTIKASGGFIIQILPDIEKEDLVKIEKRISEIKSVSDLFDNDNDIEVIIKDVFKDFNLKITDKIPVQFICDCSKEKMEEAIVLVGKKELRDIIDTDEKAEIICHFCSKKYNFTKKELEKLYKTMN